MIVQSVDGNFYRNPIIEGKRWILQVIDEEVFVKRQGDITWKTAQRPLAQGGVKCRLVEHVGSEKVILNTRLVNSTVFKVRLIKPIPTPTHYQDRFQNYIKDSEIDGEEVLKWT